MSKLAEFLRARGGYPAKAAKVANLPAAQPAPEAADSQDSQDSQGGTPHSEILRPSEGRADPLLEKRRRKVERQLIEHSKLRYALDVAGASPGKATGPVSVLLGIRTADGQIITSELEIPADRWDAAAFFAYWDSQEKPS